MHEANLLKNLRRFKLAPQTLMPDESISSLVDRQAQLWGIIRSKLVNEIAPGIIGMVALGDLDVLGRWMFLDIYAERTGVDRGDLEMHCGDRREPLLKLKDRNAYCPMCFFDDAANGYTPYFRLDWSRIFLTHCRAHQCPLFRWPNVCKDGTRKLPHEWFMGKGQKVSALPHLAKDIKLAQAYAYEVRPKRAPSRAAWDCVKYFESSLFNAGVGSPKGGAMNRDSYSIEEAVMHYAVELAKDATKNGRLCVDKSEAVVFEDQRVMSFTFKQGPVRSAQPTWLSLQTKIRPIACRRALMYRLSKVKMEWRKYVW